MLRHYDLVVERFGTQKGTMLMRKFACCYAQSKYGARHFRTNVVRVETQEQFYEVVEKYFPRELDPSMIKSKLESGDGAQDVESAEVEQTESCSDLGESCCE